MLNPAHQRFALHSYPNVIRAILGQPNRQFPLWGAMAGIALVLAALWTYADEPRNGAALTLEGHRDGVFCVAFSPDGRLIASASRDSEIKIWDAATGEAKQT